MKWNELSRRVKVAQLVKNVVKGDVDYSLFNFYSQRLMQHRRHNDWFSIGQSKLNLQILSFNN